MCLPAGHVTAKLARKDALRAIGNGVCPPQLAAAWTLLTYDSSARRITSETDSPRASAAAVAADHSSSGTRTDLRAVPADVTSVLANGAVARAGAGEVGAADSLAFAPVGATAAPDALLRVDQFQLVTAERPAPVIEPDDRAGAVETFDGADEGLAAVRAVDGLAADVAGHVTVEIRGNSGHVLSHAHSLAGVTTPVKTPRKGESPVRCIASTVHDGHTHQCTIEDAPHPVEIAHMAPCDDGKRLYRWRDQPMTEPDEAPGAPARKWGDEPDPLPAVPTVLVASTDPYVHADGEGARQYAPKPALAAAKDAFAGGWKAAARHVLEPHALDWHVEAEHGWEPHDAGYAEAVENAARCLLDGDCDLWH